MRSFDPMRNFPELDGLPEAQAKVLVNDTQKRIVREPAILLGLVATIGLAAIVLFGFMPLDGILGATIAGALVGAVAFGYLVVVVKPRMQAAFRDMGYPRQVA